MSTTSRRWCGGRRSRRKGCCCRREDEVGSRSLFALDGAQSLFNELRHAGPFGEAQDRLVPASTVPYIRGRRGSGQVDAGTSPA